MSGDIMVSKKKNYLWPSEERDESDPTLMNANSHYWWRYLYWSYSHRCKVFAERRYPNLADKGAKKMSSSMVLGAFQNCWRKNVTFPFL